MRTALNTHEARRPWSIKTVYLRTFATVFLGVCVFLPNALFAAPASWQSSDVGPPAPPPQRRPGEVAAPRRPTVKRHKKKRRKRRKRSEKLLEAPASRNDKVQAEVGAQAAERVADQRVVKALVYASAKTQIEQTGGVLGAGVVTWSLGWRAILDGTPQTPAATAAGTSSVTISPTAPAATAKSVTVKPANKAASSPPPQVGSVDTWQQEVTIRSLSVTYARSFARFELGLQNVSWGETFGSQIVDVVNPRDFRDPLNTDLEWVRLPVAAANAQFFVGNLTLQLIYVPLPRSSIYPDSGSVYSAAATTPGLTTEGPAKLAATPKHVLAEYGGRLSYLMPFGLDLGILAYEHWNRNAVYQLVDQTTLQPFQTKVITEGLTASQALGPFVLRQDAAVHYEQPLQSDVPGQVIQNATQIQTISGIDVTVFGNWFLGTQYQTENDRYVGGTRLLSWGAFKTMRSWFNDTIDTEVFYQHGIQDSDLWIQSSLTFHLPGDISWTFRHDYVDGTLLPSQGYYYLLNGQTRYTSILSFKI